MEKQAEAGKYLRSPSFTEQGFPPTTFRSTGPRRMWLSQQHFQVCTLLLSPQWKLWILPDFCTGCSCKHHSLCPGDRPLTLMSLSTLPILPSGWTPSSLTITELTMGCCCCTTLCEAKDPSSLIFEQQHPWQCLIHGKCALAIQMNRVRWIWGAYSQIQSRTRKAREVTFSHKVA